MRLGLVVLALLVAGCAAPPQIQPPAPAQSLGTPLPNALLVHAGCGKYGCFEPSLVFLPTGEALLVNSFAGPVWALATTGNATSLGAVPLPAGAFPVGATGAPIADGLLQQGPDGRTYYTALHGQGLAAALYGHNAVQVASSPNGGRTWDRNLLLPVEGPNFMGPGSDRQWLAFGPAPELYLSLTTVGTVTRVAHSADGGLTWSPFVLVEAGQPMVGFGPAGPGVVLPDGSFCLARSSGLTSGTLRVACSRDHGASFQMTEADPRGGAFMPATAATPDGALHVAWLVGGEARLTTSVDGGRSWQPTVVLRRGVSQVPLAITSRGQDVLVHGYSPEGEAQLPWLATVGPNGTAWTRSATVVHGTQSSDAGFGVHVVSSDFAALALDPEGRPWAALADLHADLLAAARLDEAPWDPA